MVVALQGEPFPVSPVPPCRRPAPPGKQPSVGYDHQALGKMQTHIEIDLQPRQDVLFAGQLRFHLGTPSIGQRLAGWHGIKGGWFSQICLGSLLGGLWPHTGHTGTQFTCLESKSTASATRAVFKKSSSLCGKRIAACRVEHSQVVFCLKNCDRPKMFMNWHE